jgi:hypothetical protein
LIVPSTLLKNSSHVVSAIHRRSRDTPQSTYQVWEKGGARPVLPRDPPVTTPLINNLLAVPSYRKRFEAGLITVVKTFFNPVVFNAHVESLADRLSEEVAWDFAAPRPMAGTPNR